MIGTLWLAKAPVRLLGALRDTVLIEGAPFQTGSAKRNPSACSIRCSTNDVGTDRSWLAGFSYPRLQGTSRPKRTKCQKWLQPGARWLQSVHSLVLR